MRFDLDLITVWNRLVAGGVIKNGFTDRFGRRIEGGVRLGLEGPEAYAVETATGLNVCEGYRLWRMKNGMDVLFNPVAGLKPHTRPSAPGRQPDLPSGAADCAFRCQDPDNPISLTRREPLVQAPFPNSHWRALPNVAPWDPRGLVIWVPCSPAGAVTKLPHLPQFLTYEVAEDFLEIVRASQGMATFFNSLHGGASASHLHFQSVYCHDELAVESAGRETKGLYAVLTDYPARGLVFPRNVSPAALWECVEKIQRAGYPLNLIGLSTGVFLFVRNPDYEVLEQFPGRAFGAINFAGLFISSDTAELDRVSEDALESAYALMTLPLEELMPLLEAP